MLIVFVSIVISFALPQPFIPADDDLSPQNPVHGHFCPFAKHRARMFDHSLSEKARLNDMLPHVVITTYEMIIQDQKRMALILLSSLFACLLFAGVLGGVHFLLVCCLLEFWGRRGIVLPALTPGFLQLTFVGGCGISLLFLLCQVEVPDY